ncbi:peptidylprolyl isomerase [Candidatus Woesebacteria bacterium]|nr:peptidylprolyl isomerase [Candidatus Woesebacteria bacterium]
MEIDTAKKYTAVVKTSKGDMTIDLYTKESPKTVNNFVFLARKGFYDGVIFHRVIKDFMIQGGDPTGTGMGDPGYKFEDEMNDFVFDGAGILAMANSGPNTNGSQFFITHAATPWLTGKHTIFGKVSKGIDVLNAIATTKVAAQDKPVEKISIKSVEIIEK